MPGVVMVACMLLLPVVLPAAVLLVRCLLGACVVPCSDVMFGG